MTGPREGVAAREFHHVYGPAWRFGRLDLFTLEHPALFWVVARGVILPRLVRVDLEYAAAFARAHPEGWDYVVDARRVRLAHPGVLRELRRLRGLEGLRSWRVVVSPGPAHWLASHAPFVRPDRIVTDLEELVAELPEAVAGLRLPGTEKPLRPPSELERDAGAERRVR